MTGWRGFSVTIFMLMLLSVLDTCILTMTESKERFKVIAGRKENVSGKLTDPVDPKLIKEVFRADRSRSSEELLIEAIACEPEYPGVEIRFKGLEGRLWRGKLMVEPDTREGSYPIFIMKAAKTPISGPHSICHTAA
jgi:hypothetical protein